MEVFLDRAATRLLAPTLWRGVRQAQQLNRPIIVSVVEPILTFDAIDLFERGAAVAAERVLWSHPSEEFALVGFGAAAVIEAGPERRFSAAAEAWQALRVGALHEGPRGVPGLGPLLLGGFAFDGERPATGLWDGFPAGRLVLPRLTFTLQQERGWLTHTLQVRPDDDAAALAEAQAALLDDVMTAPAVRGEAAAPTTLHELRSASDWQADVAKAAQAVGTGEMQKVVLARAVQLEADQVFQAGRALRYLSANYHGCYLFAVARGERCFLGATPEQLLRLRHGEVRTMSLAGSIRRGRTPEEDQQLGQALQDSVKDRNEHTVVVQAMVEALYATCASLTVGPTGLLKLGNIQHLCTPIIGPVADGQTLLDLVERLHPTPAVGGRPRAVALHWIRQHEQLDRGWYAGPVGWVDERGEGEFAVALRSALLHGDRATLFAGCGIMADSDPEREYVESSLKLKPMLTALTQ
ncbi:MAG: isochorismate synthase [Anaerolineales bacterium]|nr:isochorismate synthase [Anaerolineales bacterium]